MEITELLKKEHEEVSNLFQQFFGGGTITRIVNKMVGSRPPRRRPVAIKICDELKMHTRLEEEVFYPEVRATGDVQLNKLIDEAQREHAGVKEKIAKAQSLLDDDAALDETMSAIQSDVDHHVREEETEMFPLLHTVMSEQKLEEIGRRYAAQKRGVKGGRSATRSKATAARRPKTARVARRKASRTSVQPGRKRATTKARKTSGAAKRKTATSRSKSALAARRKTRSTQKRARAGRGR